MARCCKSKENNCFFEEENQFALNISLNEVYKIIAQISYYLQKASIDVILPEGIDNIITPRASINARVKTARLAELRDIIITNSNSNESLNDLFEFSYTIAIGNDKLTLEEYEEQGLPVRIFGFPSFLYFTVQQMKETGHRPLKLNPKSMTMLGGGWKGYADKQIQKSELYALVEEMLGIPESNCRDGYGSTEHSVPYFECPKHKFHIPVYSRMIIRDVKTLEPLPYGQPGFANFITPHLLSVPAVSVLMGDMAVLHDASECGCGIKTPFMEILGRAGTSKGKSCAITASELLKR